MVLPFEGILGRGRRQIDSTFNVTCQRGKGEARSLPTYVVNHGYRSLLAQPARILAASSHVVAVVAGRHSVYRFEPYDTAMHIVQNKAKKSI